MSVRDVPKLKMLNRRQNHSSQTMVAILCVLAAITASHSSPNQIFVRAQHSPNDQGALRAIISKGTDDKERSLQVNKKGNKTRRQGNKTQNTGTGRQSTSGPGMQDSTTQEVAGGDGVSGVKNPRAHHRGANKKLKERNKIRTKRTIPKQQSQQHQTTVERYSNENETGGGTNIPEMGGITSSIQYGFYPLMDSRICTKMDKSPDDKIELSSTITRCCKLHFNGYAVDCIIHSMQFADQQYSQPPGHVYDEWHNGGKTGDGIGSKSGKGGKSFKSGKADSSWYGWQVPPPPLPPLLPFPPIETTPPPIETTPPPIETTLPTESGSTYIPTYFPTYEPTTMISTSSPTSFPTAMNVELTPYPTFVTDIPTLSPTVAEIDTPNPTQTPTLQPTSTNTERPTEVPTMEDVTNFPTFSPTFIETNTETTNPTLSPSILISYEPTSLTLNPTGSPTFIKTASPVSFTPSPSSSVSSQFPTSPSGSTASPSSAQPSMPTTSPPFSTFLPSVFEPSSIPISGNSLAPSVNLSTPSPTQQATLSP